MHCHKPGHTPVVPAVSAVVAAASVFASVLFAGPGCDDGEKAECRVETDCPSNQTCVSGRCVDRLPGDGSPDGTAADASVHDGTVGPDGHTGCQYTDDGVIERQELVFETGLSAAYRVNADSPTPVDLVGQQSGNETVWDYTQPTASDQTVVDELLPVAGTWFAADFPDATYAAVLDSSLDTLAVFRVTDQALAMLGIVSSEPNKTLLVYDPPVDLFRFPVRLNDHHVVQSYVTGTFNWTLFNAEETYDVTVDAAGTAVVPAGSFHVLRLRTNFTQHILYTMIWTTRIIYTYLTECFGVVVRITSQDNEQQNIFTEAAEYRRMTL